MRSVARDPVATAMRLRTAAGLAGLVLVVAPDLGTGSAAIGIAFMVGASMPATLAGAVVIVGYVYVAARTESTAAARAREGIAADDDAAGRRASRSN